MINISFINASTVVTDAVAQTLMEALQEQVTRDFSPVWGVDAKLLFVGREGNAKPKAQTWWLSLLDNSDQAGALGYHDMTNAGYPLGKAFVKTCEQYGVSWSVDASHELMEMLVDPDINLICMDDSGQRLYAYEVGDPVQDDACGYIINNTLVSDFVLPAFFEPSRPALSTQFSFKTHVTSPLTLAKGGYMSYMDIASTQGWQQITDRAVEPGRTTQYRPVVGSRREKRRTPKREWVLSSVPAE